MGRGGTWGGVLASEPRPKHISLASQQSMTQKNSPPQLQEPPYHICHDLVLAFQHPTFSFGAHSEAVGRGGAEAERKVDR